MRKNIGQNLAFGIKYSFYLSFLLIRNRSFTVIFTVLPIAFFQIHSSISHLVSSLPDRWLVVYVGLKMAKWSLSRDAITNRFMKKQQNCHDNAATQTNQNNFHVHTYCYCRVANTKNFETFPPPNSFWYIHERRENWIMQRIIFFVSLYEGMNASKYLGSTSFPFSSVADLLQNCFRSSLLFSSRFRDPYCVSPIPHLFSSVTDDLLNLMLKESLSPILVGA